MFSIYECPSIIWDAKSVFASASFFTTTDKKVLIGWGARQWMKEPGSQPIPHFYFPDYFLKEQHPWCCHEFYTRLTLGQFIDILEGFKSEVPTPLSWQEPKKAEFQQAFDELQLHFANKTLSKAVPYLFETAPAEFLPSRLKTSLLSLLKAVTKHPIFAYGFWENGCGLLGGTPEVLFKAHGAGNRHLETVACAGTRAAGCDELQFLNDPKESYEHRLVIDGIIDSLARLGGKSNIGKTTVLRLARFSHLLTPIQANFDRDIAYELIIEGLHPTPALGAWPMHPHGGEWLKSYDQRFPRKRYGSPVGYYLPQNNHSICMVAIRNVQWENGSMAIGAGCGVIPDSRIENEWNELQLKIAATKEMLAL